MSKWTKQFIENEVQLPASGQRFYRDDDVLGFAVRVTRKSKSYIFEKRVDGVNRRITIGKCSELTFDAAKKQACIMLGDIARGCDPKTGRRINTLKDITLREVLEKFLEVRPIRVEPHVYMKSTSRLQTRSGSDRMSYDTILTTMTLKLSHPMQKE